MGMIATSNHRVKNAKRFVDDGEVWAVLGGQSAWTDDQNPPNPPFASNLVNTPIGAKKATKQLVIQDDVTGTEQFILNGTLTRWKVITTLEEALTLGARWVLLRSIIVGDELPLNQFREVGFFTGLVKANGVDANKTNLTAAEIQSYGILEALEYKKPISRDISTGYEIAALIEM
jgi:hypothetical protein